MQKDYAKQGLAKRNKPVKETVSIAVVFAIFLAVMGLAIIAVYIHAHWKEKSPLWMTNAVSFVKKKPVNKTTLPPAVEKKEEVHFDFYTALPNMAVGNKIASPVVVEKKEKPPALPVPPATTGVTTYYVQLGLFKNAVGASQLRLSLLLAGVEAEMVKTENQSYVVQQGPFTREAQAKSMRERLSRKGFDGVVVKRKN